MALPRRLPPGHQTLPLCSGCRQRDRRLAEVERQSARQNAIIARQNAIIARQNAIIARQNAIIARQDAVSAQLKAQLRQVQTRTRPNASNSSLPPSANPLDAPKPVVKKPTGRSPGGQPGHPGHTRERLPAERVNQVVPFVPTTCDHCAAPLSAKPGPNDPEPTWHQVAELPEIIATITEYQGQARSCSCCGRVTRAKIPDAIREHAFGPRWAAVLAYLSGCPHVSKRGIEEIADVVFAAPISLGSVANLEQQMSAALAAAHAEAQHAVQQAPVKNVDETGWKEAGRKRWLWAAATATVVCFVIQTKRSATGLLALLAGKIKGIFCSDRWSVYQSIPAARRQLCWAHLKRDFQKLVDRGGPGKQTGEQGLATAALLFDWWKAFRGGGISRRRLQQELKPVRQAMQQWLEEGARCADAAPLCQNLLKLEPALWTFLRRPGVEPTNNHIERLIRSAVLWRKIAFGCHSETGCRFVERILTVVQTLRLQQRCVLEFLDKSLRAHRDGLQPPKLVQGD